MGFAHWMDEYGSLIQFIGIVLAVGYSVMAKRKVDDHRERHGYYTNYTIMMKLLANGAKVEKYKQMRLLIFQTNLRLCRAASNYACRSTRCQVCTIE